MRGSAENIYARTHRSDGVTELRRQLEALQGRLASHPQMDALLEAVNALRTEVAALVPQQRDFLEQLRQIMTTPLPEAPSADTSVLVQCLEQLQELARLNRESTALILSSTGVKRARLLEPEPCKACLARAEPKDK